MITCNIHLEQKHNLEISSVSRFFLKLIFFTSLSFFSLKTVQIDGSEILILTYFIFVIEPLFGLLITVNEF